MIDINPGQILLIMALCANIMTFILYLSSLRKSDPHFSRAGDYGTMATAALLFMATVILMTYFITGDYRFAYVFNNSSNEMSIVYRMVAFWAGNEGSFLLWIMIYSGMLFAVMQQKNSYRDYVLTILIALKIFLLIIIVTNSPFEFIWNAFPGELQPGQAPGDGSGMNPLLMDPWMITHPPVLFLGYASAAIPFAYAVTAIIKGETTYWADYARGWIIFSMASLGVGIFMGGYWAYKVLGWGGYWGWDPVENSSLIPWIISLALLHGLLIQKKKNMLHRTNIIITIVYFALVYYSTFLTRSGLLSNFSVHSFGESSMSKYLALFIIVTFFGSLLLYITKPPVPIEPEDKEQKISSWQQLTILGIITLLVYGGIIFIGTSMPIITGVITGTGSPVTTEFYNNISIPFGLIIMILMSLATMAMMTLKKSFATLRTGIFIITAAAMAILMHIFIAPHPVPIFFSFTALFLLFQNIYELTIPLGKKNMAARLAHGGLAVMVIGIMLSGYHSSMSQKWLSIGKEEEIEGITLTFKGLTDDVRSHVLLDLDYKGKKREIAAPYFIDPKTSSLYREPYILSGITGDIYIIPEQFRSGEEGFSTAVIGVNQTVLIGGLSVTFEGFDISGMQTDEPQIIAKINIADKLYTPSIQIKGRERRVLDATHQPSGRSISLKEIDPQGKRVLLYIEPEKGQEIPADMLIVDVTHKSYIWLVWLGTIGISLGALLLLFQKKRSKQSDLHPS